MKDIVIKKTSDESQRIVLQTDSDTLDYQSRFTIMTVTGNIDGLSIPFRVGTVTSLYEIFQFLADNASAGIYVNVLSQDTKIESVAAATPKILEAGLYAIVDETSYKNYAGKDYVEEYPYEASEQYLPWLRFYVKKSVKNTPFSIEISHDGEACTFGGNTADFGQVSSTKMTLTEYDTLMFDCKTDLGVKNPKGTWTIKITMGTDSVTREVVIS